jgi:uncharacterized protein YcbK (DUF882 family)
MKGKINEFFTWEEAMCRDGTPVPNELQIDVRTQAAYMRVIRRYFDAPVKITSWFRTPAYNTVVGGEVKSKHLLGIACDFTVKGFKPAAVADVLEGLIRIKAIPEGGLGRYKTFTHYDSRGVRARWNG